MSYVLSNYYIIAGTVVAAMVIAGATLALIDTIRRSK